MISAPITPAAAADQRDHRDLGEAAVQRAERRTGVEAEPADQQMKQARPNSGML